MDVIEYLNHLGVTTVQIMGLEPHICESGSRIDSHCWCRNIVQSKCLDRPSVVYHGIPHPSYGTQAELHDLLFQLKSYNIVPILEIDLTQFSTASDWYDYDGTASASSFGSLFDSNGLFTYDGHQCNRPNLTTDSVTRSLLQTMLRRYVNSIGFSGFWWRGLLCLRLLSDQCEQGVGTRGQVTVKNSSSIIRNIADSVASKGLGYDGQVNTSM